MPLWRVYELKSLSSLSLSLCLCPVALERATALPTKSRVTFIIQNIHLQDSHRQFQYLLRTRLAAMARGKSQWTNVASTCWLRHQSVCLADSFRQTWWELIKPSSFEFKTTKRKNVPNTALRQNPKQIFVMFLRCPLNIQSNFASKDLKDDFDFDFDFLLKQ